MSIEEIVVFLSLFIQLYCIDWIRLDCKKYYLFRDGTYLFGSYN